MEKGGVAEVMEAAVQKEFSDPNSVTLNYFRHLFGERKARSHILASRRLIDADFPCRVAAAA